MVKVNVFVCGCLENSFLDMTIIEIYDKVFNPMFDRRFLRWGIGDDIFICCRDIVSFCRTVNNWYLSVRTCATDELFSCYVAMNYGFITDLCTICLSPLVKKMTLFKTTDFKLVTCECHYYEWQKIRKTNDESWKFDEIENGRESLRKMFHQKMTIFHCCISCLDKSIILNQFILSKDSDVGHCFLARKRGLTETKDTCNACLWFFIENFKKEFKFL